MIRNLLLLRIALVWLLTLQGFIYKCPCNSSIGAEGTIYLAGNSTIFQSKYGTAGFG
ncbi:MAG: hypothetical protein ACI9Q9_001358 [Flavobacterium sp.]|jgi:hypothetical protein